MIDRPSTMRPLMERGISCGEALRRVAVGDLVDDKAHALKDAVERVRFFLCVSLDGPREWADDPAFEDEYKDIAPNLDRAWHEFQDAVGEAQRIVGVA